MRSIDRRIRRLERVANHEELMRQYVDDHGNAMAKPTDPLQVLAWVIQHPLARLDLIANTANKLAQYMYVRKREDRLSMSVDEETLLQITEEGRERAAREEQREKNRRRAPLRRARPAQRRDQDLRSDIYAPGSAALSTAISGMARSKFMGIQAYCDFLFCGADLSGSNCGVGSVNGHSPVAYNGETINVTGVLHGPQLLIVHKRHRYDKVASPRDAPHAERAGITKSASVAGC
jgi:hypothetical protein